MSLLLLDTHLLLWAGYEPHRLPEDARTRVLDASVAVAFSAVSIWEVAIKASCGRAGFAVDPAAFRDGLLAQGYREVAVTGTHAAAVRDLPPLHKDPFDRIMVAQARLEGAVLLTADATMARYGEPVTFVG